VRAALELPTYIEQQFGNDALPNCVICHSAALRGPRCSNEKCNVRMHRRCARDWFAQKDRNVWSVARTNTSI
jgi:hypothetical protein